jgi:hypothetical protein
LGFFAFGFPFWVAFGVVDGADHGGGFEEFAVVDESGVAKPLGSKT